MYKREKIINMQNKNYFWYFLIFPKFTSLHQVRMKFALKNIFLHAIKSAYQISCNALFQNSKISIDHQGCYCSRITTLQIDASESQTQTCLKN